MTIGFILDDSLDRSDGVQQAVLTTGEALRSRGHEVHYLVTTTKREDVPNIHSLAKSISLPFNGNSTRTPYYASTKKIQKLLSEVKFDVLHVQMPYSPLFAGRVIARAPRDCLVVGTFHILPYSMLTQLGVKVLRILQANTHRRIDVSFAVSEPAANFMRDMYGLKGGVVPNPIRPCLSKPVSVTSKSKQIVFLGRFEKRKGVTNLLRAYRLLPKELSVELTMAGSGPLLSSAKKFSEKYQLGVKFPGFVSDQEKYNLLASADIAVFPSLRGESFGIVLLEAMSAGAGTVLAGNNPGYASVLQELPEALIDVKDEHSFANKLAVFLSNENAHQMMAVAQKKLVKRFEIDKVVEYLETIYRTKLAELRKNGTL